MKLCGCGSVCGFGSPCKGIDPVLDTKNIANSVKTDKICGHNPSLSIPKLYVDNHDVKGLLVHFL